MEKIVHRELSYVVNGCIFAVHNEVGPGLREESYQKALECQLWNKGVSYIGKPHTRRELIYYDEVADVVEPDLVVAELLLHVHQGSDHS